MDRMLKAGFDRDTIARTHVLQLPEVIDDIASGYICSAITGRKWRGRNLSPGRQTPAHVRLHIYAEDNSA